MSAVFKVDIVSLEQAIFSGNAHAIFVSGAMGELGIYPGHTQLLSLIKPGQIRILLENDVEEFFYVNGGILEVQPYHVSILADTAIRAVDLDEHAALEAKERLERLCEEKRSELEYAEASAELARTVAQLETLRKFRKKYQAYS